MCLLLARAVIGDVSFSEALIVFFEHRLLDSWLTLAPAVFQSLQDQHGSEESLALSELPDVSTNAALGS